MMHSLSAMILTTANTALLTMGCASVATNDSGTVYTLPTTAKKEGSLPSVNRVTMTDKGTVVDIITLATDWTDHHTDSLRIETGGRTYMLTGKRKMFNVPVMMAKGFAQVHRLTFEPIPSTTQTFDIKGIWCGRYSDIKGVEPKQGLLMPVESETLTTDLHQWRCEQIELRDDATILYKSVTERNPYESTYITGSTDEYIEDAETGTRYYLRRSTLSLLPMGILLHDISSAQFAEEYPALPSSVKSININNGLGQYYVKGMRIRD